MNTDGFKSELAALGTDLTDRAAVFPGGIAVAFDFPSAAEVDDPRVGAAARIVRAAATLHGELAAIEADKDRSPEWKQREAAKANERGAAALAAERAAATVLVDAFDAFDLREAAVPALAATDIGGALTDNEVRMYLRGLSSDDANKLAQAIAEGQHPRMVEAILRAPVPLPEVLTRTAAAAFVDAQERKDPQAARLRETARRVNDALRMTTAHSAGALPASARTHATMDDAIRAAAVGIGERANRRA